jgi:mono/diheme cytochrome c family protein
MKKVASLALLLFVVAGCSSARRGEPIAGLMELPSASLRNGQQVFMLHCHSCHPGGEAGLGPALNDKPLPGFMIRLQVRRGMGAMPAFPEEIISREELDDLVAYLRELRRHG